MKKTFRILSILMATVVALIGCQKEVKDVAKEQVSLTHTVKFTTEMPTKTSYDVVNNSSVKYSWEETDKDRLHVFEDGNNEGNIERFDIDDETGVLNLEVSFTDSQEGEHTYTAFLNGAVKSEQVADGKYDSDCDVLVAKPVSSNDIEKGIYTFQFRRPVAITELKLKNLKAGEAVNKVTIISDSDHPLVGKYTQGDDHTTGEWSETSSKLVVTFGTDGESPKTKTVENDGSLIVPIVSMPVEDASVKVLVETESGLKYRKVTSAALKLTANDVRVQGVVMAQVSEAVHEEAGWYLVTDASELFDGDEIRIASPANSAIAGALGENKYLASNKASFTPETYTQLTGIESENIPETFTLVEKYNAPEGALAFELVSTNGKLGTTAAKAMSYDDGLTKYTGVTEWTIAIDDNNMASIGAGSYGRIQYNVQSPRFVNYTSEPQSNQVLPLIYKKYGDASEPILKKTRTASFSPETATVTIGAQNNEFPTLSFNPEDAKDGDQTWTSSDETVAKFEDGELKLLKDGTTTIKVEIAETAYYQPCNAEYVLTVKPAPVQGLDVIDNDFVGTPSSYASWKDKTSSSSGKTYAGNSTTQQNSNNIQMRATNPSGIVVTASDGGKVARKITVKWNTSTDRTIDIYGKDSAYSSENGASDLYESSKAGDKLGSIKYGESTELVISGDYEFIGLRSNSGALYVESISIQWEDPKPSYSLNFWDATSKAPVSGTVYGTAGDEITYIKLRDGETIVAASNYVSSNTDVAEVDADGKVALRKKGDAVITATLNGDATHKTTSVSYTLHVANVLSSIKLADDSEQSTTFYVGQDFSFAGIKLEAEYNDGEKKTLTADDLTAENFSGFDSSAAVESQIITVSYTDGATETTTYNVEIKPLVTLYGITVPAEDANGNSITVKGGLTEAPEGAEIELNVNLNTEKGYKLTSLKVNEVEHSADVAEGKYTFTMPAKAVTVTAEFSNLYTVTLGSTTNGSFTVNGKNTSPVSIAYGTTVYLEATPSDGYVFKTWTVEGATVASATAKSTSFTMPANDVTVNAEFEQPQDKVYFHESFNQFTGTGGNSGGWSGSVASTAWGTTDVADWNPTNGYSADKCAKFGTGSKQGSAETPSINISTSTAKLMFKAGAWNGDGTTLKISATGATLSRTSVTLKNNEFQPFTVDIINITTSVKIKFEAEKASNCRFFLDEVYVYYGTAPATPKHAVSLGTHTNGEISATVGGQALSLPAQVEEGTQISITATPNDSYKFNSWSIEGATPAGTTATTTITVGSSDITIGASFTEDSGGGQGGGTTYTKVTSAPTDWSGTYILVYDGKACNAGVDATSNYTEVSDVNGIITGEYADCEVEIAKYSTGYSIKALGGTNKGKFLEGKGSSSNGTTFATSASKVTTLSISDGVVTITNNSNVFVYNSASGNLRWRFYKSGTASGSGYYKPTLYKKN